jgi:hypothetical protein
MNIHYILILSAHFYDKACEGPLAGNYCRTSGSRRIPPHDARPLPSPMPKRPPLPPRPNPIWPPPSSGPPPPSRENENVAKYTHKTATRDELVVARVNGLANPGVPPMILFFLLLFEPSSILPPGFRVVLFRGITPPLPTARRASSLGDRSSCSTTRPRRLSAANRPAFCNAQSLDWV